MKLWFSIGRNSLGSRHQSEALKLLCAAAVVLLAMIAGPGSVALAQAPAPAPAAPMAMVKNAINEAIVVFSNKQLTPDEREKQLREIAARHFDFASMARSAVGYHWRSFTPEQRAQFVPLFTNFIEDVYLSRIESYSVEKVQQDIKSSTIQYNNQRIDSPDYAQVFTTVTLQDRNSPLQVNYMLHRNNGEWKIYDLSVDAISVIANYRNQFNRVLNNDGYDKLISIMTQKAQGLSSTFQK
jgi:phospholipid transport system substrate-binding protein